MVKWQAGGTGRQLSHCAAGRAGCASTAPDHATCVSSRCAEAAIPAAPTFLGLASVLAILPCLLCGYLVGRSEDGAGSVLRC